MSLLKRIVLAPFNFIVKKPKYKRSEKSLDRLEGIDDDLYAIILEGIKQSPYDFGIPRNGGKRTIVDQHKMYARGRTTEELRLKGIPLIEGEPKRKEITWTLNSYHLTGKAFDIYAYVDGKPSWDLEYLEPIARHLQKVAKNKFSISLYWGQDLWGKDGAHFQIEDER